MDEETDAATAADVDEMMTMATAATAADVGGATTRRTSR